MAEQQLHKKRARDCRRLERNQSAGIVFPPHSRRLRCNLRRLLSLLPAQQALTLNTRSVLAASKPALQTRFSGRGIEPALRLILRLSRQARPLWLSRCTRAQLQLQLRTLLRPQSSLVESFG